ncbi:MAG: energy-coupling factor transporter transmembrane protein EcfT [Ruminococcaceae bacterium]|nr:energy-coupling factor transporter transmembrane protein EcfT [Oscillospiraceae bacterium]
MFKDITFGQFFPGDSVIHRLDPKTKILITIAFIVILFVPQNIFGYLILGIFLFSSIFASKIPIKLVLKSVRPLLIIIVLTSILNLFYTQGEPLFEPIKFWFITISISLNGIKVTVFMILRIMFLIMGTSMLTYTTSPIVLTDGIESLLSPLKKIHIPVHEFSMMMTIALRFIPTLIEETEKIINAQKARGADFSSGGLIKRAKSLIPILVPLFVSAFRRADELAVAMECRCYRGDFNRTKFKIYKFSSIDFYAFFITVIVFGIVIILNFI